ncbi:lantibiotic dehydratase [Phytomonospora endophytica]|uniref:Thiopeptide-type bacteriocin biosynthesis protein n=1 Tax=Phytomonospora endophytica TaxID=714109 RepID=A0A841FS87_9ACTN|nr:lantibiotic dehydratase [Phytomonospora endophytica]MBB6037673.1 thiopeptide-type bacteriocin biosynthesis protein [Phytomonospora endophytica]
MVRAATLPTSTSRGHWPNLGPTATVKDWRDWLEKVLDLPGFAEALYEASPVLAGRVDAIRNAAEVSPKNAQGAVLSVLRYLLRASGRATPFGLFAGVAPARVAQAGHALIGTRHQPRARLQAAWLSAVIDRLESIPAVRSQLLVTANNLIVERDGRLLLTRSGTTAKDSPIQVSVRATSPARTAIAMAAEPISVAELEGKLAAAYDEAPSASVAALLNALVSQRLLITSLRPSMTSTDPLAHLAQALEACGATDIPEAAVVLESLNEIRQIVVTQDRASTPAGRHTERTRLDACTSAVASIAGSAVAIDLKLDAKVTVPESVAVEAAAAATVLTRLARPPAPEWVAWHGRFLERFGLGALVPVTQAVDEGTGLGFPVGFGDGPPGRRAAITSRDERLLALAQHAALRRQREVVLDEALIAELAGDTRPGLAGVQPSTEITARVHARGTEELNRGAFTLAITGVSRNAGTTTGRFLDLLDSADRDAFTTAYGSMPMRTRGALPVQVCTALPYTATENVARAPQVLPHLLVLGELRPSHHAHLALDDIAVTADAHRLWLVWLSHGRVVEPLLFNAVEPSRYLFPLVRFLTEAPGALGTACHGFEWGQAAARLPFLPAVRFGRTLLAPARWRVSKHELPGRPVNPQTFKEAVEHWRETVACPARVYLGDGDRRIGIDLTEPACHELVRSDLESLGQATLRAAPPDDADGWTSGHVHEIVIPLAATSSGVDGPPQPPGRDRVVQVREHGRPPGGRDGLYVKVYSAANLHDAILTDHLPRLLSVLDPATRWWFLRYADPEPHLRLRLEALADRSGETTASVHAWMQRLRTAGLASRMVFDTDFPETNRFGGENALTAAEIYFAADSAAALTQLTLDRDTAIDIRAVTAASLLDLAIAANGGDSVAGMHWLVDHTRSHRTAPPRDLYDQAVALAAPDRHELATLPGGKPVLSSWRLRHQGLDSYRAALSDYSTISLSSLLPDLLHLHFTRIHGADSDAERACLHLARAAALSWTRRARSTP